MASCWPERKSVLKYSKYISVTLPVFPDEFIKISSINFSEKEIVILATTIAEVNYRARLIQALGIPHAGFSDQFFLGLFQQFLNFSDQDQDLP